MPLNKETKPNLTSSTTHVFVRSPTVTCYEYLIGCRVDHEVKSRKNSFYIFNHTRGSHIASQSIFSLYFDGRNLNVLGTLGARTQGIFNRNFGESHPCFFFFFAFFYIFLFTETRFIQTIFLLKITDTMGKKNIPMSVS